MEILCFFLISRLQHIFERKEERRGILDTSRDDRDYDRDEVEMTKRSDRPKDGKAQKQDQQKKGTKAKKLQPSLKWKTLGIDDDDK